MYTYIAGDRWRRAVELIFQSWVNPSLDTNETIQLLSIAQYDQHTPSVCLFCHEISLSAQGLSFLHHTPIEKRPRFQESLSDAKSDCIGRKQPHRMNHKSMLTRQEETLTGCAGGTKKCWAQFAEIWRSRRLDVDTF